MDSVNLRYIDDGDGTPESEWLDWLHHRGLPRIGAADLVGPRQRAVVIAPHPDDEILGCAGLIQVLHGAGVPLELIAVTDGEASHPGSREWTPPALAERRAAEVRTALALLGTPALAPRRLRLPDGGVSANEERLRQQLMELVTPTDTLLTTWRFDGHPDHEACGRAGAAVALATGATLMEFPIWAWHWARPGSGDLPWERARRLALDPAVQARKSAALGAFVSQTEARGDDDPVLPPAVLQRLLTNCEVYFL